MITVWVSSATYRVVLDTQTVIMRNARGARRLQSAVTDIEQAVDVVVIGLGPGPGGEEVASRLADAGLTVLGIERELVGGECPYGGCVPSKMIVRGAETLAEARRVDQLAGIAQVHPDYAPTGSLSSGSNASQPTRSRRPVVCQSASSEVLPQPAGATSNVNRWRAAPSSTCTRRRRCISPRRNGGASLVASNVGPLTP